MSVADLPALNACLNGTSTVLLTCGFIFIKRGRQSAHIKCMVGALISSTLFLISYLTYHSIAGHTRFTDPAWFRPYYLVLLATHVLLAAGIVPLVLITVICAIRKKWEGHKKMARITLPLWLYVSVTGVVIYFLLYHIFRQS